MAVRWYRKAAEQGDEIAQNNLGHMFVLGRGVPQDDAEGVRWYRKAAEQGYTRAQVNLSDMYRLGRGVVQDDAAAAHWQRLAADQGHADSQTIAARLDRARLAEEAAEDRGVAE